MASTSATSPKANRHVRLSTAFASSSFRRGAGFETGAAAGVCAAQVTEQSRTANVSFIRLSREVLPEWTKEVFDEVHCRIRGSLIIVPNHGNNHANQGRVRTVVADRIRRRKEPGTEFAGYNAVTGLIPVEDHALVRALRDQVPVHHNRLLSSWHVNLDRVGNGLGPSVPRKAVLRRVWCLARSLRFEV